MKDKIFTIEKLQAQTATVSWGAFVYHIIALTLLMAGVWHNNALFCATGVASSLLGSIWQIVKVYTTERTGGRM